MLRAEANMKLRLRKKCNYKSDGEIDLGFMMNANTCKSDNKWLPVVDK